MFPADLRGAEVGLAVQCCQVIATAARRAIEHGRRWHRERRRNEAVAMVAAIRAAAWDE